MWGKNLLILLFLLLWLIGHFPLRQDSLKELILLPDLNASLPFLSLSACLSFSLSFFLSFFLPSFLPFFLSFLFFRATLAAYASSQARSQIRAAATTPPDLSHIFNLRCSSQQHQILNPWSRARDRTHVLTDTSQVCYR